MLSVLGAALIISTSGSVQPVVPRDFADPALIAVGDSYYAYSTSSVYEGGRWNVPVQRAGNLLGPWSAVGDALPIIPNWVSKESADLIAPDVTSRKDGSYLLYFTARHAVHNVHCVGVAVAESPAGPFEAVGTDALACAPEEGDTIDAKSFVDTDGSRYLLYKSGRKTASIWLRKLSPDGVTFAGKRHELLRSDRPEEANIVEAPTLVRHGERYYLFYSANFFNSGRYFVNYAVSSTLTGPYAKSAGKLVSAETLDGEYLNPGGQDVIDSADGDYLIFHADLNPGERAMFVARLRWGSGAPAVELGTPAT